MFTPLGVSLKTPQSKVRAMGWAVVLSLGGAPLALRAQEKPGPDGRVNGDTGAVEIEMRNVNFRLTRDIAIEVRSLRGQLRRTNPEVPVTFDDTESFFVRIDTAEIATSAASLAALMNSYVLAYDGAPFKNVTVSIDGDRVIQKGDNS